MSIILAITVSMAFVVGFCIISYYLCENTDKYVLKRMIPILLIISDIYCMVMGVIPNLNLEERIFTVILGLVSIGYSILIFYRNSKKAKGSLVLIYHNLINTKLIEDIFEIKEAKTSYACFGETYKQQFNVQVNNGEEVIVDKKFDKEYTCKVSLSDEELEFITSQLNFNFTTIIANAKLNYNDILQYKIALFNDNKLYKTYKDVDFVALEKAKDFEEEKTNE